MKRLAHAGFAAAVAIFSPAASCGDGGERQQSGTCPAGEVCSSETEDGLHFVGPIVGEGLFDSGGPKWLATGGSEAIAIELSSDGEHIPFDLAYDARLDGPAATIEAQQENRLVLRGNVPDRTNRLRITDPTDGTLFDLIEITSADITRIELYRTFIDALSGAPADDSFLYAPGATVYVALYGSLGIALVDEGTRITGPGITQIKWDGVRLGGLTPGIHSIMVVAAGQTARLEIPVVAGPDRLEVSWGTSRFEVGKPGIVCYGSFLATQYVHVPWSFTADNADVEPSYLEGCVNVTARTYGRVVIHVRGGNLVLDHEASAVRATRSRPDPTLDLGTDGVRAATVRAWMLESTM